MSDIEGEKNPIPHKQRCKKEQIEVVGPLIRNRKSTGPVRFASKTIGKLKQKRIFKTQKKQQAVPDERPPPIPIKTKILDYTGKENLPSHDSSREDTESVISDTDIVFKFTPASGATKDECVLEEIYNAIENKEQQNEETLTTDNAVVLSEPATYIRSEAQSSTNFCRAPHQAHAIKSVHQLKETKKDQGEQGEKLDSTRSTKQVTFGTRDIRYFTDFSHEKFQRMQESLSENIHYGSKCSDDFMCDEHKDEDAFDDRYDLLAESPCPHPGIPHGLNNEALGKWSAELLEQSGITKTMPSFVRNHFDIDHVQPRNSVSRQFKRTQMEVVSHENVAIITEEGPAEETNRREASSSTGAFFSSADFEAARIITDQLSAVLQSHHLTRCAECKLNDNEFSLYASPCKDDGGALSKENETQTREYSEFARKSDEWTQQEKLLEDIRHVLTVAGNKLKSGLSKASEDISKSAAYASEHAETHIPLDFLNCTNTKECKSMECPGGVPVFRESRLNASLLSATHDDFTDWEELNQTFDESFSLDFTAISRVDTDSIGLNP